MLDRYSFIVEWYDPTACIIRRFFLSYFSSDGSIEMVDIKARRNFLKRMVQSSVTLKDLYLGGTIVVLSRLLKIVDFGDDSTRQQLCSSTEKTIALVLSNGMPHLGTIFDSLYNSLNLRVMRAKMVNFTEELTQRFTETISGVQKATLDAEKFNCGRVLIMELMGENAIRKWCEYLGLPTADDTSDCQAVPPSIGSVKLASECYGSDSPLSYQRDCNLLFHSKLENSAIFESSTCCVIKPHIVQAGLAGKVISAILDAGFVISALQMFQLELVNAEEFYEVYKGVVAEYKDMVKQLASGPIFAMEILSNCSETQKVFREFAGPADPEIGQQLRPTTLRARFGKDKVCNAVHCTDLPEDSVIEVEYFFKVLQ